MTSSPKITKKNNFSDEEVVKDFLDGVSGSPLDIVEQQDDKFKRAFNDLTKGDQRKVLEFMEFLKSKGRTKKMLDK